MTFTEPWVAPNAGAASCGVCSHPLGREVKMFQRPRLCMVTVFADAVKLIHAQSGERLYLSSHGPENFHGDEPPGIAQSKFLSQRGSAEAASAGNCFVNRARASRRFHDDSNARAHRRAVGFRPFELQRQPMVSCRPDSRKERCDNCRRSKRLP